MKNRHEHPAADSHLRMNRGYQMKLADWLLLFIIFLIFMFIIFLGAGLFLGYVPIWLFVLSFGYIVAIFWLISRKIGQK